MNIESIETSRIVVNDLMLVSGGNIGEICQENLLRMREERGRVGIIS